MNARSSLVMLFLVACSGPAPKDGAAQQLPSAGAAGSVGTAGAASSAAAGSTGAFATGGDLAGGSGGRAGLQGGGGMPGTSGSAGAAGSAGTAEGGGGNANGGAPATLPGSEDFTCSWVLGITTTGEWYRAGFEDVVDDARWQVTPIEMGHLEKWADPQNAIWQSPIQSPCAQHSLQPDRIVFNATKYEWTTVDEFLPAYLAVVNNIKTKYPSVERIDLITYGRAPGNVECVGANRSSYSYIKAAQDETAAMLPAMFPGFVFVAPKWEHAACSDFGLCPHVSAAANAKLAQTIGEYFLKN